MRAVPYLVQHAGHGGAYLAVMVLTFATTDRAGPPAARARAYSLLPGVGGLLALRLLGPRAAG